MARLAGKYSHEKLAEVLQGHFGTNDEDGLVICDYFGLRFEVDTRTKTMKVSRIVEGKGGSNTETLMTIQGA